MKVLVIIFIIVSIFGCVTKPKLLFKDVPDDVVKADNAECQIKSMQIDQADYAYRGTFMEGANIQQKRNEVMRLCLISKGYKEKNN